MCFKPSYKSRKLKNKGVVLVLVCNFLVTSVLYYISLKSATPEQYCTWCFKLIEAPIALVLPFAGWLADIYFRRYMQSPCFQHHDSVDQCFAPDNDFCCRKICAFHQLYPDSFISIIRDWLWLFSSKYHPVGIDQLTDASTDEIVSFINWYSWSFISSGTLMNLLSSCIGPRGKNLLHHYFCVWALAL